MTFPTEAEAREHIARLMATMTGAVAVIPTTHGYWAVTSLEEAEKPAKICSICQEPFREYACNAQPINNGRCCAYCDDHVVTPARIALMRQEEDNA
jgi:hypothetical protein